MQPLVDADILVYEIGFAAERGWKGKGIPPFDYAASLLDRVVESICAITDATQPPILYLTGRGNFRYDIAKRTPYKTRPGNKPYHYKNLRAYMRGMYDCIVSEGMEADDLMAIEQTKRGLETIICTRDKDLRAVAGWQFGWELGEQPAYGPLLVDAVGTIRLSDKRDKVIGNGGLFFYAQTLTGDKTDSIPGLGGRTGAVKAFKILDGCTDLVDAFKRVLEAYKEQWGERAEEELLEQGRLLWMTRELDADGKPILWELPEH